VVVKVLAKKLVILWMDSGANIGYTEARGRQKEQRTMK
jgi:hypothetical protein